MEPKDIVRRLVDANALTVLIDGRSGSGKTTLATALQHTWKASVLVHLDDIYPGWDGLQAATEHIHTGVLLPRSEGQPGRWRRWDWTIGAAAEWHSIAPDQPLIIEGAGALTAANRALADFGIWVECPELVRKQRALGRDGAGYAAYWDQWAAQEDDHIAHHQPQSVADIIVTGNPPTNVVPPA
ncbi:AAA family ATPase [soil metagenome]